MNYYAQQILNLAKQLFPKGRAYQIMPPAHVGTDGEILAEDGDTIISESGDIVMLEDGTLDSALAIGVFEQFLKSFTGDGDDLLGTMERFRSDAASFLTSMLPDNPHFTDGTVDPNDNDCDDWERRMGLTRYGVTSATTPTTEQRKLAILAKMAYPGKVKARQSAGYLESCLRSAGFDVHVYENIFPGGTVRRPSEILAEDVGYAGHGLFGHGELGHGDTFELSGVTVIANYIDEAPDYYFAVDPTYRGTFYIAGPTVDVFASVPATRKREFRQMILRLKPEHLAGYLFINYV
jgi:hypothetical protein